MRNFTDEVTDISEIRGFSEPVPDRLLPGTELHGKYRIGLDFSRQGILGIYSGTDFRLRKRVDIIEFLPDGYSERDADGIAVKGAGPDGIYGDAKSVFRRNADELRETGLLADCDGAGDFFEENNTVYFVFPSTGKVQLSEYIGRKSHSRFTATEIKAILSPVAKAIREYNEKGFFHGNITPDSIYTDGKSGQLRYCRLLAFPDIGVKDYRYSMPPRIFSAPELSGGRMQPGLQSDCYSLGAVAYRLLTGYNPSDSGERVSITLATGRDSLVPILRYRPFADRMLAEAVNAALSLQPEGREAILEVLGCDS